MADNQVPTTLPISFSKVCEVVYQDLAGTSGRHLMGAGGLFAIATGTFDPTYVGVKDRLSNFRGYQHVELPTSEWRIGMTGLLTVGGTSSHMSSTFYAILEDDTVHASAFESNTTYYYYADAVEPNTRFKFKIEYTPDSGYEILNGFVGVMTPAQALTYISGETVDFTGTIITGGYTGNKYWVEVDRIDDDYMTFPHSPAHYRLTPKETDGLTTIVATEVDTTPPSTPQNVYFSGYEDAPL